MSLNRYSLFYKRFNEYIVDPYPIQNKSPIHCDKMVYENFNVALCKTVARYYI